MARMAGPGNAATDEERARWQADMDVARALTTAQHLTAAETIEANARASVERDRRGRSSFMDKLNAEADRLSGHTPEREAMLDRAVADSQAEHDRRLREDGWR